MFHNFLLQVEGCADDSNCVVLEVSAMCFRIRVDVNELLEFCMQMSDRSRYILHDRPTPTTPTINDAVMSAKGKL